jgi:hypothetical protein
MNFCVHKSGVHSIFLEDRAWGCEMYVLFCVISSLKGC